MHHAAIAGNTRHFDAPAKMSSSSYTGSGSFHVIRLRLRPRNIRSGVDDIKAINKPENLKKTIEYEEWRDAILADVMTKLQLMNRARFQYDSDFNLDVKTESSCDETLKKTVKCEKGLSYWCSEYVITPYRMSGFPLPHIESLGEAMQSLNEGLLKELNKKEISKEECFDDGVENMLGHAFCTSYDRVSLAFSGLQYSIMSDFDKSAREAKKKLKELLVQSPDKIETKIRSMKETDLIKKINNEALKPSDLFQMVLKKDSFFEYIGTYIEPHNELSEFIKSNKEGFKHKVN
jgi:hypothetical protein